MRTGNKWVKKTAVFFGKENTFAMFTEKMFFPRKCHPENEHVPLKRDLFKGHFIFQASIFRGYSFVFRGKQFVVFLFHTVKFANDL